MNRPRFNIPLVMELLGVHIQKNDMVGYSEKGLESFQCEILSRQNPAKVYEPIKTFVAMK